jgi:multidrug efflux system outer membrane protein
MRHSKTWSVPAALGLTAGCMVGPNYKAPDQPVRPAFVETAAAATTQPASAVVPQAPPVTEWWSTFRDPELDKLIARAGKGNLDLKRAASRVRQARAQRGITGTSLLPDLQSSNGYQRAHGSKNVTIPLGAFGGSGGSTGGSSKSAAESPAKGKILSPAENQAGTINEAPHQGGPQSPFGSGGFPGVNTDLYEVGFDSTWEIDVFGGQRRGVEAAIGDIQAAQEDQRDVLVTLLAEVARNYVELRGVQAQLKIAHDNLAAQQQLLSLTQSKFESGFVTDLDVSRQKTQVNNTEATIPPLEAQLHTTIHALGVLMGEEPDSLLDELLVVNRIPVVPPEIPIGLPSDLLRRRPDVRRAERQLAAQTARVGQAIGDMFPKFSITAAFGFDSTRPKALFDYGSRYWSLAPGVSFPLFDAGRIRFNIDVQNELQAQALATYQTTVLNALKEVEDALVMYRTEQVRRESLSRAADSAHKSVELAKDQYNQGVTDFLTVLDAERDEFGTQDALAQSDRNISTDLVALYKALGGGWEIMLPEPQKE